MRLPAKRAPCTFCTRLHDRLIYNHYNNTTITRFVCFFYFKVISVYDRRVFIKETLIKSIGFALKTHLMVAILPNKVSLVHKSSNEKTVLLSEASTHSYVKKNEFRYEKLLLTSCRRGHTTLCIYSCSGKTTSNWVRRYKRTKAVG